MGHVLVQLRDIPDRATQDALGKSGLRLLNYIPDRGWFAAIDGAALTRLGTEPEIRWIGAIEIADKLPARLMQGHPFNYALHSDGTTSLRMYFYDDVPETSALEAVAAHQGVVEERDSVLHWLSIRLPVSQIQPLAAEDSVHWLSESSPLPTPLNDSIRSRIRANEVQAPPYNLTGAGVRVGMWDCTLVWQHIDFLGHLSNQPGEHIACTGTDGTENHATHVAGILAGSGTNSQNQGGTAFQWKGIAPGAHIFAYDFYSPTQEIPSAISSYGIDLSQNSWGYPPAADVDCHLVYGNYDGSAHDYDSIVTGSAGKRIPVVFAAGNSQGACDPWNSITPPATAKDVIAVGMTDSVNDLLKNPSSIGPTDDGRIKPDVVAPGARADNPDGIMSTQPENLYGHEYGTSMAAPVVSGILALMLQQYRISTASPSANPLPSTLKAMLIQGAIDLGNPGPDYRFGWGRVDAKNSVDLVRLAKYREDSATNSQVKQYQATVLGCEPTLKATLVWDDPPADPGVLFALQNDLDLTLVSPNGTVYYPWQLDDANPQNPATHGPSGDHANNVEQVVVSNPTAGSWTVVVTGTAVPVSPQPYSLVTEAFPTQPRLSSLSPASTQPGTQVVLHGDNFGCAQGSSVLTLGGGVTVTVPPGSWTDEAITLTLPVNAQTGNISVTTPAGTSNLQHLTIVHTLYLPSVMHNYPPVYQWIDASDGLHVADGDEVTTTITLPFAFKFYGNTYTSAAVSSNGFVSFGSLADSYFQSACIPAPALPNNTIYAFWADLDASSTVSGTAPGAVWYKPMGSTAVIEWQNVPRFELTDHETFEIILGADNSIRLQYQSVTNVNDVTVGIENGAGDSAIQSYCHRSSPPVLAGSAPTDGELLYYVSP